MSDATPRYAPPRAWRPSAWETMLIAAILLDAAINFIVSPYFLSVSTISDVTFNFSEKAVIALPLTLLMIAGEIDISVGGTIALASVAMGLAARAGADTPVLCLIAIGVGAACGAINGVLVAGFRTASIVATIGTMSLFRGAAYAILGDRVLEHYPVSFAFFGQGYVLEPLSFEFGAFLLMALGCGLILHRTIVGRRIFAIGANAEAARFSGVAVRAHRFWLFVAVGAAAGLASILLTSRLGSTRPSIAQGWELDIVAMVILGGVAVTGGQGSVLGVSLAALLVGLATFGFSLINLPGVAISLVMGMLLIAVVAGRRGFGAAAR